MRSQARSQQKAAVTALSARYGAIAPEILKGAARYMYESKTLEELEAIARENGKPPAGKMH